MNERLAGGLWCHEVLEHLDTYVDGGLDGATLAAVEAHVAVCTHCASFGSAYSRLVQALRSGDAASLDAARLQRLRERVSEAS